jgi:hypothetical protein
MACGRDAAEEHQKNRNYQFLQRTSPLTGEYLLAVTILAESAGVFNV